MKVLLIDIDDNRANKIDPIVSWAGMELLHLNNHRADGPAGNHNADIYTHVKNVHPEIILVDTDSPSRDVLEDLAQQNRTAPKTVITLDKSQSESINRLAADVGISLYAIDAVPHRLLQALIDVTISHFHSIDRLRSEVQELKPAIEERQFLNQAIAFIMDTYGLSEHQANDLLTKNADRQQRDIGALAKQLVETGSFV